MVPRLLQQLQGITPLLLLADYITPAAKQLLREEGVAYADAAGNMYLEDDQLYLHLEGNKAERAYDPNPGRAFTKTGLKIVFLLLQHPEQLNAPYRYLAEQAGAGLDTISKVYRALLQEKYILALNEQKYKWNKREELLLEWVNSYNKTLRPKLQQRTYRPLDRSSAWQDLVLPPDTYWGGANAGDLLTGYLMADTWTLYTGQDFKMLVKAMQWIPDPAGNIKVLEKFWHQEMEENCVPPLITYADLLAADDPRCLEAAKTIYEKYLQHPL